jgi:RNA polymerase sigma-70 factor (ECF subfamily)
VVGEERARLRSAVEALPEDLRRVIMLCEYSELSYDEIAGVLSIPAGAVGSRRHRALRQLKHQLSRSS